MKHLALAALVVGLCFVDVQPADGREGPSGVFLTAAAAPRDMTLHFMARIDGSDSLTIDRSACTWVTKAWEPPQGRVVLGDTLWDVKKTPRRIHPKQLVDLRYANFAAATMEVLHGRDLVGLETFADRMILRFADTPVGSSLYLLELRVPTMGLPYELELNAMVDGSDDWLIFGDKMIWAHRHWGQPSQVVVNDTPWDTRRQSTLTGDAAKRVLPANIVLSTARLVHQSGRGTMALDHRLDHVRVRLADNANGAGRVTVRLRFGPEPEKPAFRIVSAVWGTGHQWADVTQKAQGLASSTGLSTVSKPSVWGDPYPYFIKSLVVTYEFEGRVQVAAFREDRAVTLPVAAN